MNDAIQPGRVIQTKGRPTGATRKYPHWEPLTQKIRIGRGESTATSTVSRADVKRWQVEVKNAKLISAFGPQHEFERIKAKEKIKGFSRLPEGWDGEDADPIPDYAISRALELLQRLPGIPEVFPTGRGSIQLEYNTGKIDLEIEVFSHLVDVLVAKDGEPVEEWNETDLQKVVDRVLQSYPTRRNRG